MFPGAKCKLNERSSNLIGYIFDVSAEIDFYSVISNENGVAVTVNAIVFPPWMDHGIWRAGIFSTLAAEDGAVGEVDWDGEQV